jgi:CHASE3 domain sensor protein
VGDLATLVSAGGGLGLLAVVIGYLLNSNRADRREYQGAVDRAERRADEAEARTTAAEQRAEALQQTVDEARSGRRAAEDRAALAERESARYRPDGAP